MVRRDGTVMVGSALLLLVLLWDLRLSRVDGLVLLASFAAYLALLFARPDPAEAADVDEAVTWRTPVLAVLGLGAIIGGADALVGSAVTIARAAGLSEWVIGETVVAVGTSTPEVVAAAAAARRGLGDVAAGGLIGSNVFNTLLIAGATAAISPVRVVETALGTTTWLVGLSVLTAVLLGTGRRFERVEGAVVAGLNLLRWALDLL